MNALAQTKPIFTPQDYLDFEQSSDIRHEFVDGEVFAMVGTSRTHNSMAVTTVSLIHQHLKDSPCRAYISDMKVRVADSFFYPDIVVDCGAEDHPYYTDHPTLIVEVLSKSTRQYDKTLKRDHYFSIPTLREYLLIEQDIAEIERWHRNEQGVWLQNAYYLGDTLPLSSIGLEVAVAEIYHRIDIEDVRVWVEKQQAEQANNK